MSKRGDRSRQRKIFGGRSGDRYLGGQKWEHYLCFEQLPEQAKAIKLSMIHLSSESVEDVMLRPGSRYGVLKVTNNKMTAHKGAWSWTAQEVSNDDGTQSKTRLEHPLERYKVAAAEVANSPHSMKEATPKLPFH